MARPVIALFLATLLCAAPAAAQDADGDGVPDASDNCTGAANLAQVDTNDDGFGNACDPDWDDDGVVANPDYILLSIHYGHDNQDGVDLDLSVDGSGVVAAPSFNLLSLLFGGPPGPSGLGPDGDADGWIDTGFDNCSEVANSSQADTSADGFGNACDADWNNDGAVAQADDDLLTLHYGHQNGDPLDADLSVDGAGLVGAPSFTLLSLQFGGPPGPSGRGTDADADGWVEPGFDVCPDAYDPGQADTNGDGVGDLCDDGFEPIAGSSHLHAARVTRPLTDSEGDVHLLYTVAPNQAEGRRAALRWLRQEAGQWVEDTVWVNELDYEKIAYLAADLKSTDQLCAWWKISIGVVRQSYGCIDESNVLQVESTFSFFGIDFGGSAYLEHDADDLPHLAAYRHNLYDDGTSNRNHYVRHTRFDGSAWTAPVNVPARPGDQDPESDHPAILLDPATGVLHFVYFYYDGADPTSATMGCADRGDLVVASWTPVSGFGPASTAVAGVLPGVSGSKVTDYGAVLDTDGDVDVVYGAVAQLHCDPAQPAQIVHATGPLTGPWNLQVLRETSRGQIVSELVRDAGGDLHAATRSISHDGASLRLFTISGGGVGEETLDVDTLDPLTIKKLRAAPGGNSGAPQLFLHAEVGPGGEGAVLWHDAGAMP